MLFINRYCIHNECKTIVVCLLCLFIHIWSRHKLKTKEIGLYCICEKMQFFLKIFYLTKKFTCGIFLRRWIYLGKCWTNEWLIVVIFHQCLNSYFNMTQCNFASFIWPCIETQSVKCNFKLRRSSNKHWCQLNFVHVREIKLDNSCFL